jgi:hypothetical protein
LLVLVGLLVVVGGICKKVVEAHGHVLLGPTTILLGLGDEHLTIRTCERRLNYRARPKTATQNNVELRAVHDEPGDERDPKHEAEHEGEHAVHRSIP